MCGYLGLIDADQARDNNQRNKTINTTEMTLSAKNMRGLQSSSLLFSENQTK